MITIALPKGRVLRDILSLFSKVIGNSFDFSDRELIVEVENFRFLLVRNRDIPTYVFYQAADLGLVGLDVLEECGIDVVRLLDLNIGKCKVVLGSKIGYEISYNKPQIKVATKMPNITRAFFSKKAVATNIISLYGSIELAPLVRLSDVIVDIVETGATMRQNNLKIDEVILESSIYLVSNKNSFYAKKDTILGLYNRLVSHI